VGRRAGAGAAGQADGDIAAVTEMSSPLDETKRAPVWEGVLALELRGKPMTTSQL